MILLIDHYDSFTYNVKQLLEELGCEVQVVRNDAISCDEIEKMNLRGIVLSPGPGSPEEAETTLEVIRRFAGKIPILGICLGHQAIGLAFGGKVVRAARPRHGKISSIFHQGKGMFRKIENPCEAARYHSLIIERESLPACLEITAETEDGTIMGVRHRNFNVEGIQFHPESIATPAGKNLIRNFIMGFNLRLNLHVLPKRDDQ